jgi:CMP-N-acetylneuraminic acid synthetase
VGLVPMRHHSERVPGKNYRLFAGEPLYRRIIRSLLSSRVIDEVLIDTDSPEIMEDAGRVFPAVRVIDRPAHLREGHIPMNEVLLHDVTQIEGDYYLQTHSTNPLLRAETIQRATETFLEKRADYDSLFTVTKILTRLWDADGRPVNHDPEVLLRTQDLPPIYEENSNMYIFTRQNLERRRNRLGVRPMMFEVDRVEAMDIDTELDFRVAEFLFMHRDEAWQKKP